MDSARARGLQARYEAALVKFVLDQLGEVDDSAERNAFPGIEIDGRGIGEARRSNARLPCVNGDGSDLYRIQQRRQITADDALGFGSSFRFDVRRWASPVEDAVRREVNEADPFELFITVTEIRYAYYKETDKILGNT